MDRLAEMEAFVRVVDHGGFTDAARKLGVSKSAVSKHVAALEERLGARLLNRTTRRVSPTEIGLAFYDRAQKVLSEAQDADAMVSAMQGSPKGEIRVSAPHSLAHAILAPAIADFLHEYPAVTVHMTLDERFVELVSEGFDIAIRVGSLPDSSLKARRLGDAHMMLVASDEYLGKHGEPQGLADLGGHNLLHYSNLSSGNFWRLAGPNGEERQVRATGRLTVNDGASLLAAAERGLGIVALPDFLANPSLEAGRVREILPETRRPPLGIFAVYPPGRYPQPKLRAFIDYLAERFRAEARRREGAGAAAGG